jgi:uncharacterized protein (DUF983 family)
MAKVARLTYVVLHNGLGRSFRRPYETHRTINMALTTWQQPVPSQAGSTLAAAVPSLRTAVLRGLCARCPACGEGHLFAGWLKVVKQCEICAAPLGLARSDDLPPYLTILLVGHIVVPLMVWMERTQSPPTWLTAAIFLPLTLVLTLALMRPIKGGTVGLMLKLGLVKEPDAA